MKNHPLADLVLPQEYPGVTSDGSPLPPCVTSDGSPLPPSLSVQSTESVRRQPPLGMGTRKVSAVPVSGDEGRASKAIVQLSEEVGHLENVAKLLLTKLAPVLSQSTLIPCCGRIGAVNESLLTQVVAEQATRLAALRATLEDILLRVEI